MVYETKCATEVEDCVISQIKKYRYKKRKDFYEVNIDIIKEIINNQLYQKIRNNHTNGIFLNKCASCDMPTVKDEGPKPVYNKIDKFKGINLLEHVHLFLQNLILYHIDQ